MGYRLGQQVGNYRLVRQLGRGGFAEVYLGEHRHLKSYAALKVLQFSLTTDEEVQRFLAEAKTLVGLRHPNIVRVLDYLVERATGTPVLVMDYAPGGTIRQRHPRGSILSLALTVAYVKQVAAALQYAHDRYIIHRDVKPENILFGPDSTLLLSDFGLALFSPTPELLNSQDPAGTRPYMAPEQFQGKPTFASDQYALGVMSYEWLCGKRPFEGNQWEIVHQHFFAEPPPLREQYPELPAEIEQVVLKALAKEPQDRFASVQAFAEALERASQGKYVDDGDAEVTLPRQARSSGAPLAPPAPAIPTLQSMFLSAASADAEFAARLKADLQAQKVVFSNEHTDNALDQEEAMRQAIRAAQFVLVILSPSTRSSRLVARHMHIANMYGRQIIFVWMAGDEVAPLLPIPDVWAKTAVIDVFDARTSSYELALKKIMACLERETGSSTLTAPTRLETQHEPRNPYKGLRAFTKDEAADFFGRDALIDELVEILRNMLADERSDIAGMRLLTALGPSGSGKSSVVMAGLLPRLQQGGLFESKQWLYLDPFVPGTHPLESLARVLVPHLPDENTDSIRRTLTEDSARGLHLLATRLTGHSETKVLLVIDQFEELFAQHLPEQERQHFIDLLLTAVTEPSGPVIAVLTLRADYYDRPMRYSQLSRLIEAYHVSVLPMDVHDLRAVIEEPAAQPDVQLTFEGNLVGDLLFEAQGQPGALPLLEFTLDQLYQHREGHWLTLNAYQEIGGVKGALVRHAESTYASLPSEQHRALARTLFLRLLDPGTTEQDTTRRRASIRELSLPDEQETLMLGAVADAFVGARLLTTSEVAGEVTIEVSHEALIREWDRLTKWLREAREDFTLQKTLANDTAEWIQRGKPADRLYRGNRLIEMQAWATRNHPNRDESAFLQAAEAERRAQELRVIEQKEREVTLQRRVISHQRWLINALLVFSMVVVVLGSVAWIFYGQANVQAKIARSQALAADAIVSLSQNQLEQALLLSRAAYQTYPTFEARNSLLHSLVENPQIVSILHTESPSPISTIVFSSDGQKEISSDGLSVYVGDVGTRQESRFPLGSQQFVDGVALSPDNRTLATASATGVWLWDIQTRRQLVQLDKGINPTEGQQTPIAFSPDGRVLTAARCSQYTSDNTTCIETKISRWDVHSQQAIGSPYLIPANVNTVTFSPGAQMLAYSGDTGIQIGNVATGQPLGSPIVGYTDTVTSLAFSHDSTTLASASSTSNSASIQLWSVTTTKSLGPPLTGHTGRVTGLAFSPDDATLASSSLDHTVRVWDLVHKIPTLTLKGDAQEKWSVAFSLDRMTPILASGSDGGSVILWNINAENTISQRLAKTGIMWSPIFTPDGTRVLTGERDEIVLRDVKTGMVVDTLKTNSYPLLTPKDQTPDDLHYIQSLALSRDGTILASGRSDGTLLLWNMKTRTGFAPFRYPTLLYKVLLSENGQILAAVGSGDKILLWNGAKRTMLPSVPYTGGKNPQPPVALSPDGKLLAVGGCGKGTNDNCEQWQVQLWDVATGRGSGQPFTGYQSDVLAVAFSPDGHTLASSSQDGIRLWDVTTRKPDGQMFSTIPATDANAYGSLVFSANGKILASSTPWASPLFSFALWNVAPGEPHEAFTDPIQDIGFHQGNLAFSPDEGELASVVLGKGFGSLALWDIIPESWQNRACLIANRDLNANELKQFVKDGTSKVCSNFAV